MSPSPAFFSSSSMPHSPSISPLSLSAFTASDHSSSQSKAIAPLSDVTSPGFTLTPNEPRAYWTENHTGSTVATVDPATPSLTLNRRQPVCPYPPMPIHGTFYFRNVENPGPGRNRHYIQYACYPGYTLAHGDIHSYCQHGGTWSGVTPVCMELSPCSVNNGGCSQLCTESQSLHETRAWTQCLCRHGFTLLDDKQTCRDIDECAEGQHHCQQGCINTFGSFKCSCDNGYQLTHDQTSCPDVDECQLPVAVTGCVFGCINTPGSFHCECPAGYSLQTADDNCQDIDECADNQGQGPCTEQCHNSPGSYRCSCGFGHTLAGDGRSCVPQCPPGYRKQTLAPTPDKSTTHTLKEECVDIDECGEEARQLSRCEWQCVNLPGSHRCICPRGYTLQTDGRRCKDINECSRKNGGCSHLCVNHKGGYKCACPASHRLSPYSWKKCVPRITEDRG
ncbi:fibulin-1 [Lampris incognitus]|uniref:fibulin-1 n=1 Tax=Lampris incognitus TaxID=2546036 RepID=UPI0024B49D06|nr:fibulin-1 [Lampris incognitus]